MLSSGSPSSVAPAEARVSVASVLAAARRVGSLLAFGVLPACVASAVLAHAVGDRYAFDFRQFWQAGRDVLDGVSPYPSGAAIEFARARASLSPQEIQDVLRFPYPAPAAFAMVPFAALPFGVAAGMLTALLLAATGVTLRVLGVRDWRCYGIALGMIPMIESVRLGTLTPLLGLGLAVAWRWRDRRWIAAVALATVIVAKLFLWPLLLWLVATRRTGAAVRAAGLAAGSTLVAWAAIGFAGLREYPELLRTLADGVQAKGYSAVALALAAGAPTGAARATAFALGSVAVVGIVLAGRRRDDEAAFSLALGAAFFLTPIVWLHYFALLVVPIAIARPRLSALWFLPLAFWLTPYPESGGVFWRIALAVALIAFVLAAASATAALARRRPTLLAAAD